MIYNIYKKGSEYEKKIEEIIKEKANNIYEKYYSDNPDSTLNEEINDKTNFVNKISLILKKTLITPRRKRYLDKTYDLAANDTFGADSNIFFSPNFEESLKYLSPSSALDLFEEKYLGGVNRFYADEHLIYQEDNGILSYFTSFIFGVRLHKFTFLLVSIIKKIGHLSSFFIFSDRFVLYCNKSITSCCCFFFAISRAVLPCLSFRSGSAPCSKNNFTTRTSPL